MRVSRGKSALRKILSKLCWILLEHKCLYYKLVSKKYSKLRIPDSKYDELESHYVWLCGVLRIKPSINKMVGFDLRKPSCSIVYAKIRSTKKRIPINKTLRELRGMRR